jgi:glutathione S-transferase
VAVSLQMLGLRFEHQALSVFRHYDEFRRLNPVVRVPTLVSEDGVVLMDSTLILDHAERQARPRSLMPADALAYQQALHTLGLALAAGDKSVALFYERNLRPADRQHEPWAQRVSTQLRSAYEALEAEFREHPPALDGQALQQPALSTAVFWHFTQRALPGVAAPQQYPALAALSELAEALPAFRAAPHGETTMQAQG